MKNRDLKAWMWSDAVEMLARAERMHRDLFRPAQGTGGGRTATPQWEPPVDVLETDHELRVLAALPGVDPEHIQVSIVGGVLIIAGQRILPPELRTATIHRLELPQGRFERQLQLPKGRYEVGRPTVDHGCLLVVLRKLV